MEKELISKYYYQTILDKDKKGHPIQILGEMYMDEKQKERPDFSSIRFAQGEVYYLNHDYEAAIYKWENILDDNLKPWAQKNIADAHFEMELLEIAEDIYKEVETSSIILKTEVLLQLFSIYIKMGKLEKAVDSIKNAVQLNPDYAYVTETARSFFEDYKDHGNAVELAVNEAIRTKSLSWFAILEGYVEQGLTVKMKPNYLKEALMTLVHIDKFRFESLTTTLWNSYKQSDFYFPWLKEINYLLLNEDLESSYIWKRLPHLYEETYFGLISGRYLIKDISELIQCHLTNWMKISIDSDPLFCSSAILAWNEIFPSQLNAALVSDAENVLHHSSGYLNGIQDGIKLLESIHKWAEKEGLLSELSTFINPMMEGYILEEDPSKIQDIMKKAIGFLIEKRIEIENAIIDKINWNEELLAKLNGIHHQLRDMEEEKVRVIKYSFSKIKNEFKQNLMTKIPELLRNCSDMVNKDSDFGKLHVDLNEEMNRRIASYIENTALLDFKNAIQRWIVDCEVEFKDSQSYLDELSESFNSLYGEKKITMDCEFKVLGDWRRDIERIIRGMVPLEKVNILLRNTPSQLLLKSAGKLLSTISKSKEKLHLKYKNFIENADYSQVALLIVSPFMQQLELFERSIGGDIALFFVEPFEVQKRISEEAQGDIVKHKDSLNTMREKPENYRDPLTLFELKLRQYELMNTKAELIPVS